MSRKHSAKAAPFDLRAQKLVICLGPGGVGKTTISAALAVHGAVIGCAVDVMTVDPAPRLLDALGLAPDSSEPVGVELEFERESSGEVRDRRDGLEGFTQTLLHEQVKAVSLNFEEVGQGVSFTECREVKSLWASGPRRQRSSSV